MREVPPKNGIGLVTHSVYCIPGSTKSHPFSRKGPYKKTQSEHQPYSKYRV